MVDCPQSALCQSGSPSDEETQVSPERCSQAVSVGLFWCGPLMSWSKLVLSFLQRGCWGGTAMPSKAPSSHPPRKAQPLLCYSQDKGL